MPTKRLVFILIAILGLLFAACSKKTTLPKPTHTATFDSTRLIPASSSVKDKPAYKAPLKTATPKVIVVNDQAASKAVNGKYYYDLQGKRYWRNNRDGKFYLYYKGMFENKDFQ